MATTTRVLGARGLATRVQRTISGTFFNARWPSERSKTLVPSAEQRAKWKEQKSGWRLANKGDTWYAAERRLWKLQMTELRKEWMQDALERRREQYIERRAAARDAESVRQQRLQQKEERKAAKKEGRGFTDEELELQQQHHQQHR